MSQSKLLFNLICCLIVELTTAQQTNLNSQASGTSSKTTLENICSTELSYIFSDKNGLKNTNVLVGCKIKTTDVLQSPMSPTLSQLVEILSNETVAVVNCERLSYFDDNMTSIHIPYNFRPNAQPQPNTFTLACLRPSLNGGHLTLLYATIIFDPNAVNQENSQVTVYFERKIKIRLPEYPVEAKYKQFPEINIRLPADFFYPFSCSSTGNSFSWIIFVIPTLFFMFFLLF